MIPERLTALSGRASHVSIVPNSEFTLERLREFLRDVGDLERVSAARSIVVKPNLCAGTTRLPDTGVVVSAEILELLLRHLRDLNPAARIAVVESDSIGYGFAYDKFAFQDYEPICASVGADLVDVSRTKLKSEMPERPIRFKQGIWLSEVIANADYFISFGKLKTHNMTTVSISMKNLFGCLPDSDKSKHHPWIDETVVDIVGAIRPDLMVIDSSPALEGNGPVHGTPVRLDYVMLGSDPVATDAVGARILGFEPERIRHVRLAADAGYGKLEPDRVQLPAGKTLLSLLGRPAAFISREQRVLSWTGLRVQQLGLLIAHIGHLVHLMPSVGFVVDRLARRGLRLLKR